MDSRNSDDKLESMTRTLKKNESEYSERIESLKREIERLKQINQQLQSRNDALETDLNARNQENKRIREEKRVLEDAVRAEKDRFMTLEIEIKRIKMECEMLERDKNSEISRLKSLLESKTFEQSSGSSGDVRRMEEELQQNKRKYDDLVHEFERYKLSYQYSGSSAPVFDHKPNNNEQIQFFEKMIKQLKEDSANQSKASLDLVASVLNKLEEKDKEIEQDRRSRKQIESQNKEAKRK